MIIIQLVDGALIAGVQLMLLEKKLNLGKVNGEFQKIVMESVRSNVFMKQF